MEEKFIIMMAPLMLAVLVYVIMGIANHKKRVLRYEEYSGIFGPFKAYMFVSFCLGPIIIISGIIGLILKVDMQPLSFVLGGIAATLLAVLIGYLTAKKAGGDKSAIAEMFFAGLGTFWHIELWCLKIAFFFILIAELLNKRRDD